MRIHTIAALTIFSLAAGCTPTPEKVCDKMTDLFEKKVQKMSADEQKSVKQTDDDRKRGRDECVKQMTATRDQDPEGYKCASKCLLDMKDLDDLKDCGRKCPDTKKANRDGAK